MSVSIRAPRERGDQGTAKGFEFLHLFQSAPPVRGATDEAGAASRVGIVSIRAPRERGDRLSSVRLPRVTRFNPRPP